MPSASGSTSAAVTAARHAISSAGADGVDRLSGDCLLFDTHRQVEAELEQQFEEDVLLSAVGLQVLD